MLTLAPAMYVDSMSAYHDTETKMLWFDIYDDDIFFKSDLNSQCCMISFLTMFLKYLLSIKTNNSCLENFILQESKQQTIF